MVIENSISVKSRLNEQVKEYLMSLQANNEDTKQHYGAMIGFFVDYLENKGIERFEDATKTDFGQFLSTKRSQNTRNLYIFIIKNFYTDYLGKKELVEYLHQKSVKETITPSELLTPEEVMKLAMEVGRRREMNKVIILTLFESCARISELLALKVGDVIFASVVDKEGNRRLMATLYFKRSKGNVKKQPLIMTMYASELKRWVENHPDKSDGQAYLFPSPRNKSEAIDGGSIAMIIERAGKRLGIKKRLNPHFFRHSGLSYLANNFNYNEQLLMWRAGWTSTLMAQRYIHSGGDLEAKAYLEKMGCLVEDKPQVKILSKNCPHCKAINPYTNTNCDLCAMPLALDDYKLEIEKRRSTEALYQNINKIYTGKITQTQKEQLSNCTNSIKRLTELGREDLAEQYIQMLLESWVKMFLT
jgi:integrase